MYTRTITKHFGDGNKKEEKIYDDEYMYCYLTRWYENGTTKEQSRLKQEIYDGRSLGWYENGMPMYIIDYKADTTAGKSVIDGYFIQYGIDGKVKHKDFYVNGELSEKGC